MANDPTRQVHSATHPSGHPNKTPVNAENPIFARPADPVPAEASIEQTAVVQSAKHPRETVQSPLINEEVASPAANADDWTKTKGEGITSDTSSADSGAEYRHSSGAGSSKITPVEVVALPTQEQADAIVAEADAEMAERRQPSAEVLDAVAADPSVAPAVAQIEPNPAAEV